MLAAARSVALVTGPAGVGKTALVASVLAHFAPAAVLSGTARIHSPAPYDWLAVGPERPRPVRPRPRRAAGRAGLARPARRDAGGAVRAGRAAARRGAGRAVARRRRPGRARGRGPARARPGEPQPGRRAGGRARPAGAAGGDQPARLAAATGESSELVARTLARLAGVPGAVRQHLGPLPVSAVADLLASAYPGRVRLAGRVVGADRRQPLRADRAVGTGPGVAGALAPSPPWTS